MSPLIVICRPIVLHILSFSNRTMAKTVLLDFNAICRFKSSLHCTETYITSSADVIQSQTLVSSQQGTNSLFFISNMSPAGSFITHT